MKVDLNFPEAPQVSSEAKDLISRVSFFLVHEIFLEYQWASELCFRSFF